MQCQPSDASFLCSSLSLSLLRSILFRQNSTLALCCGEPFECHTQLPLVKIAMPFYKRYEPQLHAPMIKDDFDTTGLCENLKTELKDRHESFKSCIMHISLPDGHQVDMRHIMEQKGLLNISSMIPGIQCFPCISFNMFGERNIHISVLLH